MYSWGFYIQQGLPIWDQQCFSSPNDTPKLIRHRCSCKVFLVMAAKNNLRTLWRWMMWLPTKAAEISGYAGHYWLTISQDKTTAASRRETASCFVPTAARLSPQTLHTCLEAAGRQISHDHYAGDQHSKGLIRVEIRNTHHSWTEDSISQCRRSTVQKGWIPDQWRNSRTVLHKKNEREREYRRHYRSICLQTELRLFPQADHED